MKNAVILMLIVAGCAAGQGRRGGGFGGGGGFRPLPPAPPVARPMPGISGSPIAPFGGFQPSIVTPGTPIPAFGPAFPQALSATIQGRPLWFGGGFGGRWGWNGGWGGGFGWGGAPLLVPLPVGGFGWGGGAQTIVVPQAPPEVPVVIINQSYQPERLSPVLRDYSNTSLPSAAAGLRVYDATVRREEPEPAPRTAEAGPVVYLIALKDSTVATALAYWVDGETLHYVTPKQAINKVSFALIDRELTERLNRERNVELRLPR
jgi:hypothetical protein